MLHHRALQNAARNRTGEGFHGDPLAAGSTEGRVRASGSTPWPKTHSDRPVSDETQVVQALREGKPGAAAELCRRVYPVIAQTVQRMLRRSPADVDDLIQITLERVVKSLVDGRLDGVQSLAAWASGVAAHATIDHCRSRARETRLMQALRATPQPCFAVGADARRALEARSDLELAESVLSKMKRKDALALVLSDAFGHSRAEVASVLHTSESGAQSRLSRARKEFLKRIQSATKEPA